MGFKIRSVFTTVYFTSQLTLIWTSKDVFMLNNINEIDIDRTVQLTKFIKEDVSFHSINNHFSLRPTSFRSQQ